MGALSRQQRELLRCLSDGGVVIEAGGVVRTDDLWTDRTIASLVSRGLLVRAPRLDQGTRRAYRLGARYVAS